MKSYVHCHRTGVMKDTGDIFAISGKKYEITDESETFFTITSELGKDHYFEKDNYQKWFDALNGTFSKRDLDFQIENEFNYHPPKDDQPRKYEVMRSKAKELAYLIMEVCPNSEERSEAIKNLRQTIFWANASIAVNDKGEE